MKNAIIVHGMPGREEYYSSEYPSSSNFQWLPWLQKQLLIRDIYAVTPEMQYAYRPDYSTWSREFERFDITAETILVGHSAGGGFLIRWLSEHAEARVGKVVLVAPWLDPERTLDTGFFNFVMDPHLALRTRGVTIFNSLDDDADIQETVASIRDHIKPIKYVEFEHEGHFIGEKYVTNGFPALLEEILSQITV